MERGHKLLADWLEKSHTTQRDLAGQLGMSDGYLSQILAGLRRPKLEMLDTIQTVTGVPVSSWLDKRGGKSDARERAAAK